MKTIRSPIVSVLGHVDHGKTTLLDRIRGTAIAKSEPGAITQHISASYVSAGVIQNLCSGLMERLSVAITVPGLLFIDSPGHEAFTTLRKRGGSIADIAILVVDINKGFQPQTDESLNFLTQFKTPFVVAATKIDSLLGWAPKKDSCFIDTAGEQGKRVQDELEEKIYRIAGEFSMREFEAERYDRVSDFRKYVSIVPVSSKTGEGIADLLVVLCGVCQRFLSPKLSAGDTVGKGTILEVKDVRGLGMTIDVILYDGGAHVGDTLVIGGKEPLTAKIKALLEPAALEDMRIATFRNVASVSAAAGVKIAAPGLEKAVAGMPVRILHRADKKQTGLAVKDIQSEIGEVEFESQKDGVILRADTLGSLEALIKSLSPMVPIRKAQVGNINKSDVVEAHTLSKPIIFAFGMRPSEETLMFAKSCHVTVFHSDVIYRLLEEHAKWEEERKAATYENILLKTPRPARMKVLQGFVFRQKKPAIFGVEILAGTIKPGYRLAKGREVVGTIREIQSASQSVKEAKPGDKVAISVPEVTIGKDVAENDELHTYLSPQDIAMLKKVEQKLRDDERQLLAEMEASF